MQAASLSCSLCSASPGSHALRSAQHFPLLGYTPLSPSLLSSGLAHPQHSGLTRPKWQPQGTPFFLLFGRLRPHAGLWLSQPGLCVSHTRAAVSCSLARPGVLRGQDHVLPSLSPAPGTRLEISLSVHLCKVLVEGLILQLRLDCQMDSQFFLKRF